MINGVKFNPDGTVEVAQNGIFTKLQKGFWTFTFATQKTFDVVDVKNIHGLEDNFTVIHNLFCEPVLILAKSTTKQMNWKVYNPFNIGFPYHLGFETLDVLNISAESVTLHLAEFGQGVAIWMFGKNAIDALKDI